MSDLAPRPEDYPLGFRGLVLNEHRNTSGAEVVAKRKSTIIVRRFDFSPLQLRDQRIGRHQIPGGEFGFATKQFRYLALQGEVKDTTPALLEDRVSRLLQTFDLEEAQYAALTAQGQSAFDFYVPTAVPPSGYTSPVRELFLARPFGPARVFERAGTGLAVPFAVELVCGDTARYLYTAEAKTANAAGSWSVACPNWDANMGELSYPVLEITVASGGSYSATHTITFTPTTVGTATALILDLSGEASAAFTIWVDMRTGRCYKAGTMDTLTRVQTGGTRRDDLPTSDPDTFWGIPRNGGTMSVTGTNNITSVKAHYRQARG